jgi:hypothetical protein
VFFFFNFWKLVHERFFVEFQQNSLGQNIVLDYNFDLILYVLGALLAVVFGFAIFFRKQFWRFLTSMQLGIVLIFAVTIGTTLGTLVFQNANPEDYTSFYGQFLYFIFTRLNLTDVFDAWWFLAFELLLALSLICVTIRTKPWTLGRIGVAAVHLGIVAVIIGAFIGVAFMEDGILFLGEGETATNAIRSDFLQRFRDIPDVREAISQKGTITSEYDLLKPENNDIVPEEFLLPLGGSVKLDDFEELYYEEPYIVSLGRRVQQMDIRTMTRQEVVRIEMQMDFTDTKPLKMGEDLGVLRVNRVFRNFRRDSKLVVSESGIPLVKIKAVNTAGDGVIHKVFGEETFEEPLRGTPTQILPHAEGINQFLMANNAFRLRLSWGMPDEEKLQEIGLLSDEPPYIIMARQMRGEMGDHLQYRLDIGESQNIEGTEYSVKILRFFNHLQVKLDEGDIHSFVNGSDLLMNPAVELEISGGHLEKPMAIILTSTGAPPNDAKMRDFVSKSNIILGFFLAPPSELLLVGESNELYVYQNGTLQEAIDLAANSYQPLYSALELSIEDALANAVQEDMFFDDSSEPSYAVELQVTRGDEVRTGIIELMDETASFQERVANRDRYFMYLDEEEKNFLNFHVRGDYIKDWRSNVTVTYGDRQELRHSIRVNEPLIFNGFYFYQSDWQPKVPYGLTPAEYQPDDPADFSADKWYTYLRVVNDPGLPLVYIGIAMLTAGIFWAFYIGPRFRRNKKTGTSAGEEE